MDKRKKKSRIDFTQNENTKQMRPQFIHQTAIYIRYVNPQITADKMMDIVEQNKTIKDEMEKDPDSIQVTRLVKSTITEEQIAGFRNGVSYRIGCKESLISQLSDKSNWATHWEIRPWMTEVKEQKSSLPTMDHDNTINQNSMETDLDPPNKTTISVDESKNG